MVGGVLKNISLRVIEVNFIINYTCTLLYQELNTTYFRWIKILNIKKENQIALRKIMDNLYFQ